MSKLSSAIIIILVLLILGLFYYLAILPRNSAQITNTPLPAPTSTQGVKEATDKISNLKAGGNSYADPNGLYNFLYPNDYKLDLQNKGKIVRIYKTGPTQKGQTEMYDGVIVVFETAILKKDTLSNWVDEYIKTQTLDGTSEITESKKEFSIKSYQGFSFKLRGLGESQYYAFQKDASSPNVLIVTTAVHDPGNLGFQKEVNNIFSTIELFK